MIYRKLNIILSGLSVLTIQSPLQKPNICPWFQTIIIVLCLILHKIAVGMQSDMLLFDLATEFPQCSLVSTMRQH